METQRVARHSYFEEVVLIKNKYENSINKNYLQVKLAQCFLLFLLVLSISEHAIARDGDFTGDRITMGGLFGYDFLNPAQLNNYTSIQSTTPRLANISSGTSYGGFFWLGLPLRLFLEFRYEAFEAKNLISTSGGPNNGITLNENQIWQIINFRLISAETFSIYIGGGIGYSAYSHATIQVNSTKTEYDGDKNIAGMGKIGLEMAIGKTFGFIVEGAYVLDTSYTLNPSRGYGSPLQLNGKNIQMDLSGARIYQGLVIRF